MAANKDQGSRSPSTAKSGQVRQHMCKLLQKLTAHVKRKSVEGARPKADREEQRSRDVAYV